MTDPGFADRTYLEPLDLEGVSGVLLRERPDALLATMGGGTALNLARQLHDSGLLDELGIELIGADIDAIQRAEDRELFKQTVEGCGLKVPTSRIVTSLSELEGVSLPAVVRPAFTLGGHGGGFADTVEQLRRQVERGLSESPISQVLVEESVRGWDEFELEVVRDRADNVVIVCSIENLDPMGVHTGDSVTVAPVMTLSDEAFQELRDSAIAVVRAVGVDTGGSNIQFARHRENGDLRVIEMNPRVSRSSALASKATGYPIAKVAAKLAVGYTLDEIPNDLTRTTPASFEPTLDYVVVKIPRFAFEKFPGADSTLGTQMKSVGETMGIGRTFIEAFVKAKRGLEGDFDWHPENMHSWFVHELEQLERRRSASSASARCTAASTRARARSRPRRTTSTPPGTSATSPSSRAARSASSSWLRAQPHRAGSRVRLLLRARRADVPLARLRGRDGQLQPRDGLDRLRHERPPLLRAARHRVACSPCCEREQPDGVVIQFGGQTPLKLARAIEAAGFRIIGTPFDAVDLAEDRERFGGLLARARHPLPGVGDRRERRPRRSTSPSVSVTRCSCARRTCSAGAPCASATTPTTCAARSQACRARRSSTASSRTRSRSTSTRSATARAPTSPRSCSTSRRPASIRATRRACCRRSRSRSAATADIHSIVSRLGPALGVVGLLNVQLAVADDAGVRARGQPARVAHRAVRLEGDRRQPRRGRVPARRRRAARRTRAAGRAAAAPGEREGSGASVRALPGRRPGARPRDARDRRGDDERERPADCAREGRARGRPVAAARRRGVPLGPRLSTRRRRSRSRRRSPGLGFHLYATGGTARTLRGAGLDVDEVAEGERAGRGPSVVDLIRRGRCNLVVNTPDGGPEPRLGRLSDPRVGSDRPRAVHHDDRRGHGCRARDRERSRRDRPLAAGAHRCRDPRASVVRSSPSRRSGSSPDGSVSENGCSLTGASAKRTVLRRKVACCRQGRRSSRAGSRPLRVNA